MNLGDPELEVIDPTPNVYNLFIQFDKIFFWTKLASRSVVSWSKRMYSCAGVCSYEGSGGLCKISLSEPLLKLRPRKDLVETLLHEMIHAFLFITNRDRDRDGHGPNFQAHMHRINKSAGLNISIYHDFHDEVKLYQIHWWRCDGPCQRMRPYFGIVRRSMNKAPGPSDNWWNCHMRKCGGTFIKIKEPEKKGKKSKTNENNKNTSDITKYIKTQNTVTNKLPVNIHTINSVLKDSNVMQKSNSNGTMTIKKTQHIGGQASPQINKPVVSNTGHTVGGGLNRSNSVGVVETVRNIWANKQLNGSVTGKTLSNNAKNLNTNKTNTNKHKIDTKLATPPMKIKKIDDYFKTAESLLKDVYGQDFNVTQSNNNKLVVSPVEKKEVDLVPCPICNVRVDSNVINRHLDECLNRDVIKSFSNDNMNNENKLIIEAGPQTADKNITDLVADVDRRNNINNNFAITNNQKRISVFNNNKNEKLLDISDEHKTNTWFTNNVKGRESGDFMIKEEKKVPMIHKPILIKSESIPNQKVEQFEPLFQFQPNSNRVSVRKSDSYQLPKEHNDVVIKIEPGTSSNNVNKGQKCACCSKIVDKPIQEHLDECLAFFDNNTTIPEEGASTSIIVIDDDNELDETLTMNATGTKLPCPCCLQMVEEAEMNSHLDMCLS